MGDTTDIHTNLEKYLRCTNQQRNKTIPTSDSNLSMYTCLLKVVERDRKLLDLGRLCMPAVPVSVIYNHFTSPTW